jgi:hypothetical protein
MGSKSRASQYQMDDHSGSSCWNSGNVTVFVILDVQQDVVPVKKQN